MRAYIVVFAAVARGRVAMWIDMTSCIQVPSRIVDSRITEVGHVIYSAICMFFCGSSKAIDGFSGVLLPVKFVRFGGLSAIFCPSVALGFLFDMLSIAAIMGTIH